MWAQRHRHLSLRHTIRVPAPVREALQGGSDPPCPVSGFALYQLEGTTVVLSNLDSRPAVEMYVTPREGQERLLRGVVRDLMVGLYGCRGLPDAMAAAPQQGAVAVQVYCEDEDGGGHLVTSLRGVVCDDGLQLGSVDCTVVVAARMSNDRTEYRHVRTRRRRKRITLAS